MVDLIEMKALIWKSENLGAEWDVVDIPEDLNGNRAEISRRDDRSPQLKMMKLRWKIIWKVMSLLQRNFAN